MTRVAVMDGEVPVPITVTVSPTSMSPTVPDEEVVTDVFELVTTFVVFPPPFFSVRFEPLMLAIVPTPPPAKLRRKPSPWPAPPGVEAALGWLDAPAFDEPDEVAALMPKTAAAPTTAAPAATATHVFHDGPDLGSSPAGGGAAGTGGGPAGGAPSGGVAAGAGHAASGEVGSSGGPGFVMSSSIGCSFVRVRA
jgi:hypothetical protein